MGGFFLAEFSGFLPCTKTRTMTEIVNTYWAIDKLVELFDGDLFEYFRIGD